MRARAPRERHSTATASRQRRLPASPKKPSRVTKNDIDRWRLRAIDEVPEWMRHNPFIRSGYRLGYTATMCLQSVMMVHNETGNIWTHLIGLLTFVVLATYALVAVVEFNPIHFAVFVAFAAANVLCMGSSAAYHLFSCHSEPLMRLMIGIDYFGISALITASFLPLLVFTFSCYPYLQALYVMMLTVLGGATLVAPFVEKFKSDQWFAARVLLFVITAVSGIVPTLHSIFLFPKNVVTAPIHTGIVLMFVFYGIGTFVYVTKIPESLYPGRFDVWFNSHQLWHVLVLLAAVVHFFTCVGIYQRWGGTPQC